MQVLSGGFPLILMHFMGRTILIKYQTIKAEHKTVIRVTEEPLIFTIDNMPESTIVSIFGIAGFSPQIRISLPAF